MNVRIVLLLPLAALLAGCGVTAEQRAQRDNDRCAARGYQPNTAAYTECLRAVETERQMRTDSRHRDLMEKSNVPAAATR